MKLEFYFDGKFLKSQSSDVLPSKGDYVFHDGKDYIVIYKRFNTEVLDYTVSSVEIYLELVD